MHPLVTAGFNADFDGDTAAIHRPVTAMALEEAKSLLAHNNLFSPANGSLTLNLGQDVALGAYFLTASEQGRETLAKMAGYSPPEARLDKNGLSAYLSKALSNCQIEDRAGVVEKLKGLFFSEATSSGLSLSIPELPDLSAQRDELMADKQKDVNQVLAEMKKLVTGFFQEQPDHPLAIMRDSRARGDDKTMTQVVGMRGPMEKIGAVDTKAPPPVVVSSLREGMKTGEYFVSCYGSRTTLVDKKMGTADAGYVTRKLAEITHRFYISGDNCIADGKSTRAGLAVGPYEFKWLDAGDFGPEGLKERLDGKFVIALLWKVRQKGEGIQLVLESLETPFDERVGGRISRKDPQKRLLGVKIREERSRDELHGKFLGRVLLNPVELGGKTVHLVETEQVAIQLADWVLAEKLPISIRSPLTCEADHGVCRQCYGLDLATMNFPEIGHKVGIIAAQSIGEPGTQLVLRSFHSGGVMGVGISRDIPKVERFLNAKSVAQMEAVKKGLPKDSYPALIDDIKGIYLGNGVNISDQHFEILLMGMLSRFRITEPGSASFYPGQIVEKEKMAIEGGNFKAQPVLSDIGILKRSLTCWLSAASFENTLVILAMAAIGRKTDRLLGLKENVILGRLLPPNE
jgi:DNA-directed RNA polymerase subunit beta'